MITNNYDSKFYRNRHEKTVYTARIVLSILNELVPSVNSAIDFGCGVGTWLAVLKGKGVEEILGLDGAWVDQEMLEIPRQNFREVDFEKGVILDKKYDLAISVEVAEHLSPNCAEIFVGSLTQASDFVLFSAAIPFQGGVNHVNEQWQDYWVDLFRKQGFLVLDVVRRRIWNDHEIPVWYRQNILLFARKESQQLVQITGSGMHECDTPLPISIVHPEMYLSNVNSSSITLGFRSFMRALVNWSKRKLGVVR